MVSFATFVVASSMLMGQVGNKTAMPAPLREQIEKSMIGDWVFEVTFGEQKITGHESWRWAGDKSSLIIEGCFVEGEKETPYTCIGGWESGKACLVVTAHLADGNSWVNRWTDFSPQEWKGTVSGMQDGQTFESPCKITFLKDSVRYEDTTVGKPWISIGRKSEDGSSGDAEKTFASFAELAVGGTWIADVDGKQFESKYESILDGKFLLSTGKAAGVFPDWVSIMGIDPVTKQLTSWGVDGEGGVSIERMKLVSEGVWINDSSLIGPSRSESGKSRLTKIDQYTVKFEVLETTSNGKTQPVGPASIFKRQR